MTQLQVFKLAADMAKAGMSNEQIWRALLNTKGTRVAQINKALALLSPSDGD